MIDPNLELNLSGGESGYGKQRIGNLSTLGTFGGSLASSLDLSAVAASIPSVKLTASGGAGGGGAAPVALSAPMNTLHLKTNVANSFSLSGVRYTRNSKEYVVKASGEVQRDLSPVTGIGTTVGTMMPAQGEIVLNAWSAGGTPQVSNFRGMAAAPVNGPNTPYNTYVVTFRVPIAPLRTGSFTLLGTMRDGTTFNVSADANGYINGPYIKGRIDYTNGVVRIIGTSPTNAGGQPAVDLSFLGIPGVGLCFIELIQQETLRFNAVAYTYLPADPVLLGIDPVRLPTDGRVPIFAAGGYVVVGHTAQTAPVTAVNGGSVNCGRTRLSRVRVLGADNKTINTGYTVDLEAGIVTWTDTTGYVQPVRVEHRIEDMAKLREVQIDGTLTLMRPLTHDFPAGSGVSSAYMAQDMYARVGVMFDQVAWSPQTFSDTPVGNAAVGTYNDIAYPVQVTNAGAVTERWALLFKSNTTVDVIGEHVGVVASAVSINTEIAPISALTGKPYFRIAPEGWGNGWAAGNVVQFPTYAAIAQTWLALTVKPGPETGNDHAFSVLMRGGVDNPI